MSYIIPDEAALKARSQRFVWRIFMMRQLGTSLCFVAIASVMWDMHYHLFYFALLAVNALSGQRLLVCLACRRMIPSKQKAIV
jgi:hypothetical protein